MGIRPNDFMIEIVIKTDGNQVVDRLVKEKITMNEAGIAILKLEKIKQELLDIEWDTDLEINK